MTELTDRDCGDDDRATIADYVDLHPELWVPVGDDDTPHDTPHDTREWTQHNE